MFPNEDCEECEDEIPAVEVPPPPVCEGEECEELVAGNCVKYTGPAIPCLGILANSTLNTVIQAIANRLCDCCDGSIPDIDCVVSSWSAWGPCIDGTQTRTRVVIQSAQNGGTACPTLTDTRVCCTPTNCVVSQWGSWSICSNGTRSRTRTIITPASCEGTACPPLIETEACTTPAACDQPINLQTEII